MVEVVQNNRSVALETRTLIDNLGRVFVFVGLECSHTPADDSRLELQSRWKSDFRHRRW